MGIRRLNIPVACRDFPARLAAPLPYCATLVVLFNTTCGASLPDETLLLGQSSPGIGFYLTRQSSAIPIVCFIKQSMFCAHEEFDFDSAPNLSTPGLHINFWNELL